jgi:hypothetical protein
MKIKAADGLYMLGIIEELKNLILTHAKHYITPLLLFLTSLV